MANIIFWSSIFPLQKTRPIGCYQLAHHLRKNGITAQVIDFCGLFSPTELVDLTQKFIDKSTIALGISTSFWTQNLCYLENHLRIFKDKFPNIKIIVGGPRANNPVWAGLADHIFVGEAENQLTYFISETLLLDKSKINLFDITKLDHRFIKEDCILPGEVLPIELGRGCIFKCKFCSHHNLGKPKFTYQRQFSLIEEEIRYNFDMFQTTHYLFLDDTVNEDLEKIQALTIINNKMQYQLNWNGYLRADLIWSNKGSDQILLESGLQSCFFGIESFHPKASSVIGKGWSGKHAKDFLPQLYEILWHKDVSIWNNFIVGLPYETEQDIDQSVDWCLNNTFGMNRFVGLNLYTNKEFSGTQSEFTKNYTLYGYRIKENGEFYNEHWNSNSIHEKLLEIGNTLAQKNKLSSWLLFDAYNITRENLSYLKTQKLNYPILKKLLDMKKNYKQMLLDL